jgi:hypothetical protein
MMYHLNCTNYQDMFGNSRLPAKESFIQTAKAHENKTRTFVAGGAGGVSSAIVLTPFSRISTIQQTALNANGGGNGTQPFCLCYSKHIGFLTN